MSLSLEGEDAIPGPHVLDSSGRQYGQREQLEYLFKSKFEALRNGYNERLKRLQHTIDNFHREFVGDEVVRAMKADSSTSVYVPAHISETIFTEVADERERYIHELIQKLGTNEMNFQELAIECRDWKERARALQRETVRMQSIVAEHQLNGSQAEVLREELERLRERVAGDLTRQQEIASLKQTVQERNRILESAHADIARSNETIHAMKKQQQEFERRHHELQTELGSMRQQLAAETETVSQERSARQATEHRLKELLDAYRTLESNSRSDQQAVGLAENQIVQLQQAVLAKDAEMEGMKRKLASVMSQVEQMLDAEATENGNALEMMQEKLRRAKQKYAEEAKRYKRAASATNEELTLVRSQLDDARRELKQVQEETKVLRQVCYSLIFPNMHQTLSSLAASARAEVKHR